MIAVTRGCLPAEESVLLSDAELNARVTFWKQGDGAWKKRGEGERLPFSAADYPYGNWEGQSYVLGNKRYEFAAAIPIKWYGSGVPGSRKGYSGATLTASRRLDMVMLDCIESTMECVDALFPA